MMWREALGLSKISAGFIAVLVGYSSSAVIILQAADAVGATSAQMSSWLWALGVGMGLTSIGLSLYYKNPVLTAWSTPGAALMVTSLAGLSIQEAVGAFLISSLLIALCGLAGWMDKLIRIMPQSVASAMLAGILLQFGLKEKDVISFMRANSKPSSFRMWRKRMAGRSTKHIALRSDDVNRFKCNRQRSISMNKISKR